METTVLYSTLYTPGKATNTLTLLYMIANAFSAHYPILSYASLTNKNYNCFRCAECNHVPTDTMIVLLRQTVSRTGS